MTEWLPHVQGPERAIERWITGIRKGPRPHILILAFVVLVPVLVISFLSIALGHWTYSLVSFAVACVVALSTIWYVNRRR